MRFRKNGPINVMPSAKPAMGWAVKIQPAAAYRTRAKGYHYDMLRDDNFNYIPVKGAVAVRLCLNGEAQMTYGTAQIDAEDFEDTITTLKAGAEEKCAVLNAVDCGAA